MRRFLTILRPLAAVVLFFVVWQFCMVSEYVAWAKEPAKPGAVERKPSSAEKFGKNLEELERLSGNVVAGIDGGGDVSGDADRIGTLAAELDGLNTAIEEEFAATGRKLDEIDAAPVIHEREAKALKEYRDKFKETKRLLNSLKKSRSNHGSLRKDADNLGAFLKANKPKSRHIPLDPNNLPHRAAKARQILPKETKEEYDKDERFKPRKPQHGWNRVLPKNGIKLASAANDMMGMFNLAHAPGEPTIPAPTPEDLAPTIDAQLTDAIRAKAGELGNQPLPIYQWVRNNIEFVPTYGSIQGADYCLQTKQCNAFDTASLLIALLRAAGIHARYLYGTIEISADKAMNWVGGVEKPETAVELLNAGGIPAVGIIQGSRVVSVRLEHVWVEGWIDYVPSRGAIHRVGDNWIPLDASWKQYIYSGGIDLATAGQFNAQGFVDHIQSSTSRDVTRGWLTGVNSGFIQQQMADYSTSVEQVIGQMSPHPLVADVLGKKDLVLEELSMLASVLPYKQVAHGGRLAALPPEMRYVLRISVVSALGEGNMSTFSISVPEIVGKALTIGYAASSQADEEIVERFRQASSVPAYLIQVKPVLMLDGARVREGAAATLGTDQTLELEFVCPGNDDEIITKTWSAGTYHSIVLNSSSVPASLLRNEQTALLGLQRRLSSGNINGLACDEVIGAMLAVAGLVYFAEMDQYSKLSAAITGVVENRLPSAAVTSTEAAVDLLYGVPLAMYDRGLSIDMKRNLLSIVSKTSKREDEVRHKRVSGLLASAMEHSLWNQLYQAEGRQGISTISVIAEASRQGIPIYEITSENLDGVLEMTSFPMIVQETVRDAVHGGLRITIPATAVVIGSWQGHAFVVYDPVGGNASYVIQGGLYGGILALTGALFSSVADMILTSAEMRWISRWNSEWVRLSGLASKWLGALGFAMDVLNITSRSDLSAEQKTLEILVWLVTLVSIVKLATPIMMLVLPWGPILLSVVGIALTAGAIFIIERYIEP